jgi:hypothetical protein
VRHSTGALPRNNARVTSSDDVRGAQLFARLIPGGNLAGSLYGVVLVTSVLAAFAGTERVGYVIAAVIVTTSVFALAHAWAHALARSGAARAPLDRHAFVRSLGHEFSIVQAALPATLVLLVAALDVYSVETALWIAVLVNVALLFTWGAGLRQLAGGAGLQVLGAGLASSSLGLVLILLKILVH